MNIASEQVADIAKIYHEYNLLMDSLTQSLADSRSRSEMQEKAKHIIINFIPRYKRTVPKEVQEKLGLRSSALENNILRTSGLKN